MEEWRKTKGEANLGAHSLAHPCSILPTLRRSTSPSQAASTSAASLSPGKCAPPIPGGGGGGGGRWGRGGAGRAGGRCVNSEGEQGAPGKTDR